MIIVTQAQLRNKDTEAIILLRNEIKASFNTNAIDYFTISAIAEILYNNPTQLRPIELVLPIGHEIDVESSDLSKGIIRFKRK